MAEKTNKVRMASWCGILRVSFMETFALTTIEDGGAIGVG